MASSTSCILGGTQAGNMVIVAFQYRGTAPYGLTSINDSQGNSFAQSGIASIGPSPQGTYATTVAFSTTLRQSETEVVTIVTINTAGLAWSAIGCYEVEGATSSGVISSSGTSPGMNDSVSVASYTPPAESFVIAFEAGNNYIHGTIGIASPFTLISGINDGDGSGYASNWASGSTTATIKDNNGQDHPLVELSIAYPPAVDQTSSIVPTITRNGTTT